MTSTYDYKKAFVEEALNQVLFLSYPEIDYLEYERDENTRMELVHVFYIGGERKTANVTGDSLSAIIKDVLKQVVWVYE